MKQIELNLRRWGGKRAGAGRKPNGPTPGVPHLPRARVRRAPLHVTWKMRRHVWNLRTRRCFRPIERALWPACDRFGMRINHFSVQGNHVHLIVEADDGRALARGMQGLGVRIAKALNRVMEKRGGVMADRFHSRLLRTPTEVRRAIDHVLRNHVHHLELAEITIDRFSSAWYAALGQSGPVAAPRTWLLKRGSGPPG